MGHDVFISYSHHDKSVADAVCNALESDGLRCWIAPRDVLPGSDWAESILKAIAGCRAMVLIFSSSANQSAQVPREVERAVSKEKIIVPFRVENIFPSGSLEYALSTTHWLDAVTPPMEQHFQALRSTLRRILDHPRIESDRPAKCSSENVPVETPCRTNLNPPLPVLFQLRVIEGPNAGQVFPLSNTRMIVGRHPDCDIPLSERSISRQHCAIQWDSGQRGFVVVDFRASSPILINGEILVNQHPIALGDVLKIAHTAMVLEKA